MSRRFFPNEDLGISNFLPAMRIRAISYDRDLKIALVTADRIEPSAVELYRRQ